MTEILLPFKPGMEPIDFAGPPPVPLAFRGRVSAVCRSIVECEELPKFYGSREWAPVWPVLLMVPGHTPIQVVGAGVAPAAELADLSVATWNRAIERLLKYGTEAFPFDEWRERDPRLPRREDRETMMAEAIWRRRGRHLANHRTDPAKVIRV